jgi:signal transduction histidine kinase
MDRSPTVLVRRLVGELLRVDRALIAVHAAEGSPAEQVGAVVGRVAEVLRAARVEVVPFDAPIGTRASGLTCAPLDARLIDDGRVIGVLRCEGDPARRRWRRLERRFVDLAAARIAAIIGRQCDARASAALLERVASGLRGPAGAIMGYADAAAAPAAGPADGERQARLADGLRAYAARVLRIVDGVAALGREACGQIAPARPAKLAELVLPTVGDYRRTGLARPLDIHIDVPEDLRVLVDPERTTRAIGQLLDHVVRTGWGSGCVTITACANNDGGVTLLIQGDGRATAAPGVAGLDGDGGFAERVATALLSPHGASVELVGDAVIGVTAAIRMPAAPRPH